MRGCYVRRMSPIVVRWALVGSLLAALAGASGCATLLSEPRTPFPRGTPLEAPWALNRELLLPETRRILIVVDWIAGPRPDTAPLDALVRVAARYGERAARWIPREDWSGRLEASTSYVFVGYVGQRIPGFFGLSYTEQIKGKKVHVILVNQERHRQWRGVIPEGRSETTTLVHEYGHLLGLPTAEHGYFAEYPSFFGGAHCVSPTCALSKPRPRAILYGVVSAVFRRRYLDDYCEACRRAIAEAKAYWRRRP
jgi:hypothetical protein